nr:MAG TPA: hypothetical protein [Crassvirales sp.]
MKRISYNNNINISINIIIIRNTSSVRISNYISI